MAEQRSAAEPGSAGGLVAQNALLRLTSANEFERVRRDGRSHAHPLVVLVARRRAAAEVQSPGRNRLAGPQPDERPRFGFVAGKGAGSAVQRNRAKRLLREAARRWQAAVAPSWDLLLIARRPLAAAGQAEVNQALAGLLKRAGCLAQPDR
jgi:ribonuclease P protein component